MATGDQADVLGRLKRVLPASWFGPDGSYPVIESLLQGAAWVGSFVYAFYAYAKAQTRIATMTGAWLTLAAYDFFDPFPRFTNETDASFSRRIRLEVFRPRNTRPAIDRIVYDLTGEHPAIFESWRAADCGGWGVTGFAYGEAGAYGCRDWTEDVLISVPTPAGFGFPGRGGWGDGLGGYGGAGDSYLVDPADATGNGATLAEIVTAIDAVRTAGITYYVRFV